MLLTLTLIVTNPNRMLRSTHVKVPKENRIGGVEMLLANFVTERSVLECDRQVTIGV